MNRTKTEPASTLFDTSNQWEPKCPFDFVIAYQDTATRNRVYNLYDHLAQQLIDDFDFRGFWYKFDFLANPTVRDTASDQAAQAHMVVFSLRQGNALPGHVIDWIDAWTACRGSQKSALVTLVAGDDPEARRICPIQNYLQKTAHCAGMDFFAHNFDFPGNGGRNTVTTLYQATPNLPSKFVEDVPYRPKVASHWGINE